MKKSSEGGILQRRIDACDSAKRIPQRLFDEIVRFCTDEIAPPRTNGTQGVIEEGKTAISRKD